MRTLTLSLFAAALAACASADAQNPSPVEVAQNEEVDQSTPPGDLGLRPDEEGAQAEAGENADAAPAPEAPLPQPTEIDLDEALADVDAYLAGLDVLTGDFYQIEPTGYRSEGRFWIDRPGKMRFEYADPHPFLLVADGATYTVWDRELEDVNTEVPLRETPLNMFLRRDVEIGRDANVIEAFERDGELWLTLEDTDDRVEGRLTLVFARPSLELRRFVTTDAEGAQTHVVLANARAGGSVDQSLFVINQPRRRERR